MMALVIGVSGDDKSGKTSFAMSAPQPIFHMGLDIGGFNRASHRYLAEIKAGVICNKEYPFKQQALMDGMFGRYRQPHRLMGMKELWFDEFLTDYYSALVGETPPDRLGKTRPFLAPCGEPYKTIVMDNATLVWNLDCMAFLQEKQEAQMPGERVREKLQEMEYGEPNARFRALVNTARAMRKNLILLHPLIAERKKMLIEGKMEDVETGRMVPTGWRYTTQTIDMMVETTRRAAIRNDVEQGRAEVLGAQTVVAKITLSGMALELNGMDLPMPDWRSLEMLIKAYRGEE